MLKFIFPILLLFISETAFSQVDYEALRDKHYTLSCGAIDSVDLIRNQVFVDSLLHEDLGVQRERFLNDYSMVYYTRYLKWKDLGDIRISLKYTKECWETYQNTKALWGLGHSYGILGDCDKELELTELYVKTMKENGNEEFISYKQVYYRYKFCREE
jgi:hypothetical protein